MKRWNLMNGRTVHLLTPIEFQELSDGAVLWDIFGNRYVKGRDQIDGGVRSGHLAYGLMEDQDSSALISIIVTTGIEIVQGRRQIELEED